MAAGVRRINTGILLLIANYPQFILNQYQEVAQKPAHLASPKYNIPFPCPREYREARTRYKQSHCLSYLIFTNIFSFLSSCKFWSLSVALPRRMPEKKNLF